MRKSFWRKKWGSQFGIICCVCGTNHCISKLNSPFYMFFQHKLDSVNAYMTIKSHFNRSTTTKSVSRFPVSFEISVHGNLTWEKRDYIFFFLGGLIVSFKNTHYTIFHKTYEFRWLYNGRYIMTTSRSIGTPSCRSALAGHYRQHVINCRLRILPMCPEWLRLSSGLPSSAEAWLW